jgi:hypothetical protein
MQDDTEERRAQDKRDLEFYRSRIRPTSADLWRIVENPPKFNGMRNEGRPDELIWPLLASVAILLMLALTGMIGQIGTILP